MTKIETNIILLLVLTAFRLTQVNKWLNKAKTKGVEDEHIFNILFVLVFVDLKNISQLMHSGYGTKLNYGMDVLYDFLKNEWVDWKIFLNKLV
jgi:hypothetical protein